MYESDLKYCPECNDEYIPRVEQCAACGVQLLTGAEMLTREEERRQRLAGRRTEISEEDDLVAVRRGPLTELKHLEKLLRTERLGTMIVGDPGSCGGGCCPSVYYLQVRRREAGEALQILEAEHRRVTGLDHHDTSYADVVFNPQAAEALCPACGCRFATSDTTCPECGLCLG